MYACFLTYVYGYHVHAGVSRGQMKVSDPHNSELQTRQMGAFIWVLENKPGSCKSHLSSPEFLFCLFT